nr:hypothetical protein [uncultured Flavobacterium sp.]
MLYFLIIASIVILFVVIGIYNKNKNKRSNIDVTIDFEDIDSLNVSKIVKVENDIDFTRNELWFQFKQKQKINAVSFYKLKQSFEIQNNIKINQFNETDFINSEVDTLTLIEKIISDETNQNELIKAFIEVEKRLNLTIS